MPGILVLDGIYEDNPRDYQLYVFETGELYHIGKSETCDIILDDPEVSRVHAALSLNSDGVWRIKLVDNNTKITINDQELEWKRLRNGDKIGLGNSTLHFYDTLILANEGLAQAEPIPKSPRALPSSNSPSSSPAKKKAPSSASDKEPFSDTDELLDHPELNPPGIYLTHGGILGEYLHIDGQILLGRSSQCTLVFRDVDVSRTHASLEVEGDGRVMITDLASRNGVYVNDRRIVEKVQLNGFDLVRLGNTEFIFLETDNNIEMFKKLVRRGSILLKKVSSIGSQSQGIMGDDQMEFESPAEESPQRKSLVEVFRQGEEEFGKEMEEEKVKEEVAAEAEPAAAAAPAPAVEDATSVPGIQEPEDMSPSEEEEPEK